MSLLHVTIGGKQRGSGRRRSGDDDSEPEVVTTRRTTWRQLANGGRDDEAEAAAALLLLGDVTTEEHAADVLLSLRGGAAVKPTLAKQARERPAVRRAATAWKTWTRNETTTYFQEANPLKLAVEVLKHALAEFCEREGIAEPKKLGDARLVLEEGVDDVCKSVELPDGVTFKECTSYVVEVVAFKTEGEPKVQTRRYFNGFLDVHREHEVDGEMAHEIVHVKFNNSVKYFWVEQLLNQPPVEAVQEEAAVQEESDAPRLQEPEPDDSEARSLANARFKEVMKPKDVGYISWNMGGVPRGEKINELIQTAMTAMKVEIDAYGAVTKRTFIKADDPMCGRVVESTTDDDGSVISITIVEFFGYDKLPVKSRAVNTLGAHTKTNVNLFCGFDITVTPSGAESPVTDIRCFAKDSNKRMHVYRREGITVM